MILSTDIENTVAFTVPYLNPITGNHYKRPCRYRGKDGAMHMGFKVTPAAKAYYDAVAIFARGRTVAPATDAERRKARYGVRIDVYLAPKGRSADFDNYWKCGLDALVHCGAIHSDNAVDGEHSKCVVHRDQRDNPRTEYLVTRLESE
jgi:Holliday junction resolvase RusA-like endonuclease